MSIVTTHYGNFTEFEPGLYIPAGREKEYQDMLDQLDEPDEEDEEFEGEDEEFEGTELDDIYEHQNYYDNDSDFELMGD